jgi:hypothetical protein
LLQEIGGFDISLNAAQDYDVWLRLSEKKHLFLCLYENLQKIGRHRNIPKITNSKARHSGKWICYNKYKHLLNRTQRAFHLFKNRQLKHKRLKVSSYRSIFIVPWRYKLVYVKRLKERFFG